MKIDKTLLPVGTKYVGNRFINGSMFSTVIIEYPPNTFLLPFFYPDEEDGDRTIGRTEYKKLSLPYRIFIMRFVATDFRDEHDTLRVGYKLLTRALFFRTEPLKGLDDNLYRTGLPNCGDDKICSGNKKVSFAGDNISAAIAFFAKEELNAFFNCGFKHREIDQHYASSVEHGTFKDIDDWEQKSKKDPSWVLKEGVWRHAKERTLSGVLNYWWGCDMGDMVSVDDLE